MQPKLPPIVTREVKPKTKLINEWLRFQCGVSQEKTVTPEVPYPDGSVVQFPPVKVQCFHLLGYGTTAAKALRMAKLAQAKAAAA